ncbi:MAG: scavenger receptor cysteine-rich domain-containing protein [Endozoicomonadaceae bacterium]|nr:scavenger receptor cysteine-rich domain-containing protein [Endozoicomonadaceae bacterium]
MQSLNYLLKQKKEHVDKSVKNKWNLFFLSTRLLIFSFFLLMMNSAYSVGTENQTQVKEWTFVTEESLSVNETDILANTPMQALKFLQKAFPNQPVEILHKFSFEAKHKHLGENDNKRKTYFSSIPGLKEAISVYSFSKLPSAIARKNPCWLTLSGMMEHLKQKKEAKDPQFEKLLKVLHAPLNTEEWYIYDGGTIDEAINNVAMEAYHSFKRGFKWIWNRLQGKEDNNTLINTDNNILRQQIYKQVLTWHNKRAETESVKYIATLDDINPKLATVQNEENSTAYKSDDTQDNYTNSSESSKPFNKIEKCLFSALMISQCFSLGASVSVPTYFFTANSVNNYCLAPNGQCTYVGNANISRLMTEFPGGDFIAAESINGGMIPLNHAVAEAVVPEEFSGTFSTGEHSLDGFPINGRIPLFESVNNSFIKCNIPVKLGSVPDNAQSLLTRRVLHSNRIETTLQWSDKYSGFYYTHPIVGNIQGNNSKLIVKHDTQRDSQYSYFYNVLVQKSTGIIATEVSGNHNHLEHQGAVQIVRTIDNDVPGNIAKIISGTDNKLIQKGAFIVNRALNPNKIALTNNANSILSSAEGNGTLEIAAPIEGTNDFGWRAICSQRFSHANSKVACRQLGFTGNSKSYTDNNEFSLPAILRNIRCTGNEASLLQCPYDTVDESNCTEPPVAVYCMKEKNYNNDAVLYSGISRYSPTSINKASFILLDKDGFLDFGKFSQKNSVRTTQPADWRKAYEHLCTSEQCDISCHYVNEKLYSVIRYGNKTLLVSHQYYPARMNLHSFFNSGRITDAKGLIRITDISQRGANGTIKLYQPRSDSHLGKLSFNDPAIYTPPVSEIVINGSLLSFHRYVTYRNPYNSENLGHSISYLDYNNEIPGIQLGELSLDVTGDSTYNSTRYDFPGENALLLSENAAFTHNQAENTIIQHPLKYNGEHYTLDKGNITYQLPPEPLITAGKDGDYFYVVTTQEVPNNSVNSKRLIFSRYNLQSGEKDNDWERSEQPDNFFNEANSYEMSFNGDEIKLIRRDQIFILNGIPYGLRIPQGGGCSEIQINQVHTGMSSQTGTPYLIPPSTSNSTSQSIPDSTSSDNIIKASMGPAAGIIGVIIVGAILVNLCGNKKSNNNNTDNLLSEPDQSENHDTNPLIEETEM